jgi:hypothetical protein
MAVLASIDRRRATEEPPDDWSASAVLIDRARSLKEHASTMHPLVASAYRRRAAELNFAAWVGAIRAGRDVTPNVVTASFGVSTEPAPPDAA